MQIQTIRPYREELANWLRSQHWDLFVTWNPNVELPQDVQVRILRRVTRCLDVRAVHRRPWKRGARWRLQWALFPEVGGAATHTHYHGLLRLPEVHRLKNQSPQDICRRLQSWFSRAVRTMCPSSSVDVQCCHDRSRLIGYVLKDVSSTTDFLFLPDSLRAGSASPLHTVQSC
jgi:hypothetical protein